MEKNLVKNLLKRQGVKIPFTIEEINLGGSAYIIETRRGVNSGRLFIMGKRSYCPFPDRPYFTIIKIKDREYCNGHYDLTLIEAYNNLIERAGVGSENESISYAEDLMHPEDTALEAGMDDLERMEYEYNLMQWEKEYNY